MCIRLYVGASCAMHACVPCGSTFGACLSLNHLLFGFVIRYNPRLLPFSPRIQRLFSSLSRFVHLTFGRQTICMFALWGLPFPRRDCRSLAGCGPSRVHPLRCRAQTQKTRKKNNGFWCLLFRSRLFSSLSLRRLVCLTVKSLL